MRISLFGSLFVQCGLQYPIGAPAVFTEFQVTSEFFAPLWGKHIEAVLVVSFFDSVQVVRDVRVSSFVQAEVIGLKTIVDGFACSKVFD